MRPSQRGTVLVTVSAAGTRPTGTVLLTIRRDGRTVGTRTVSLAGGARLGGAAAARARAATRSPPTYGGSPTVGTSSDVSTLRVDQERSMSATTPTPSRRTAVTSTGMRSRAKTWLAGAVALAAAVGGAAVAATPASGAEGDLTTDLVGWWKLDETHGHHRRGLLRQRPGRHRAGRLHLELR